MLCIALYVLYFVPHSRPLLTIAYVHSTCTLYSIYFLLILLPRVFSIYTTHSLTHSSFSLFVFALVHLAFSLARASYPDFIVCHSYAVSLVLLRHKHNILATSLRDLTQPKSCPTQRRPAPLRNNTSSNRSRPTSRSAVGDHHLQIAARAFTVRQHQLV